MKYLKKFESHSQYESYIATDYAKPNVSYILENEGAVYYHPTPPRNIITYKAANKLTETTSTGSNSGLHIDSFSGTNGKLLMTSHTFEDGVGTIEFDGDITVIGDRAFNYCSSLTSIEIPDGVTSIEIYAFYNCTGLTSINIPDSVTSIGYMTFYYCKGLTSINIPDNITSIGNYAFEYCSGLTSIDIPSGVTSIGNNAFSDCTSLVSITSFPTTAPSIQSSTFYNIKRYGTLYVPQGSSGYDTWMGSSSSSQYYLRYYSWTKTDIT